MVLAIPKPQNTINYRAFAVSWVPSIVNYMVNYIFVLTGLQNTVNNKVCLVLFSKCTVNDLVFVHQRPQSSWACLDPKEAVHIQR